MQGYFISSNTLRLELSKYLKYWASAVSTLDIWLGIGIMSFEEAGKGLQLSVCSNRDLLDQAKLEMTQSSR